MQLSKTKSRGEPPMLKLSGGPGAVQPLLGGRRVSVKGRRCGSFNAEPYNRWDPDRGESLSASSSIPVFRLRLWQLVWPPLLSPRLMGGLLLPPQSEVTRINSARRALWDLAAYRLILIGGLQCGEGEDNETFGRGGKLCRGALITAWRTLVRKTPKSASITVSPRCLEEKCFLLFSHQRIRSDVLSNASCSRKAPASRTKKTNLEFISFIGFE